ncbi:MAG: M12 family metallopeptidase [Actinobacteria bacterium]|nr:M12 family metallopeptidase [Actinomycetota bacterium]
MCAAKKDPPPTRPEELGSGATGTTVINGLSFVGKRLTYAKVGELAMFEGDIVLGRHADLAGTENLDATVAYGVAITGSRYRWPNALVPYEIDPAMPDQFRVTDALAHWTANTAVHFVQRTPANAGTYPNYVHFFAGGGCYSTVGMVGGRQDISLGAGCSTGNAIHEIGHTIGLWHEQSREDRDSFVTIVWANIDPAMAHNFDQHISDGDDLGAYDYGSVMHYPATAFSTNGQPTIVPVQPGVAIGQRTGLSPGDLAAVDVLYPRPRGVKKLIDDPVAPKKLRDDIGGVKKLQDDQGGFKKVRDDTGGFKKLRDDTGGAKKLRDDIGPKKIRDEVPVKQLGDLPVGPGPYGPGPLVNPGYLRPGELPLILATGHHADAAAAYEAAYGLGYTEDDPSAALLASAAASAEQAALSLSEVAAALRALLGQAGAS